MAKSNCYGCKAELAWGIADPRAVADKVYAKIGAFVAGLRPVGATGSISIGPTPPNIAYFCENCWARRMSFEPDDVTKTGAAPPAQTLPTSGGGLEPQGISFACSHKAYRNADDSVNWPRCIFIFVHELMHWFSHNHVGFQPVGKALWSANWDEMATDYIASHVFPMVATAEYSKLTFYNNDFVLMPELLCQGFGKASKITGWKKPKWEAAAEKAKLLPHGEALLEALTNNKPKAVGWHWCRMYFNASDELAPFIGCFDELKANVFSQEVATLACETEYVAGCKKGLKRPVHT